MTTYIALLRGIGPLNPNMRNDKLRGVFESLGFTNVKTVISSGNVVFESGITDIATLEQRIEEAWPAQLGFHSTTIIRTAEHIHRIIANNPFKDYQHNNKTYLTVTFLKRKHALEKADLAGYGYEIIALDDHTIYSIVDMTTTKTPNLMLRLEKLLGKEITTRTWKTVERLDKAAHQR